jgi:dTDP-4-amino-4,6-dideoxygalactose transaminase
MHPLACAIVNAQLPYLDEWNELRRQNLDYLTERLRDVPGVIPPVTRPHVTRGGYYGYKPVYEQEQLDGLPIAMFIEALQAEGVRVKRPDSRPLHLLPLFQAGTDKLYHHGYPWECAEAKRNVVYQQGDMPIAERMFDKLLSLPTFTDPAKELIDQYIVAFQKVAANAAAIRAALSSQQETGAI